MKKILVTGDFGYIGSALVPLLLHHGYKVVGFDTDYFEKSLGDSKPQFYKRIIKDIRKAEKKDLEDIDCVIHLAALSNDPMGEIDPKVTEEINFKSTIRVAELAKEAHVKRFIFSSSCSIYGIAKSGVVDERSKVNPITEYAKSKINVEKELMRMADNKFCTAILRNSTVYGYSPKFRSDLVVNDLTLSALINGKIRVKSDGTAWRPLLDVRDLSNIFKAFIEADSKTINKEIFNIGFSENNFQVKTIAETISEVLLCGITYNRELGKDSRSYSVSFDKFHSKFPNIVQKWPLEKSVKDLSVRLSAAIKNPGINREDYVRLVTLQDLISKKRLNHKLYWNK
ncbi:MAG: SDR family oxidoreductase [Patescibacteria group bacterium]